MNIVFWLLVFLLAFGFWYLMSGQFRQIGHRSYKMVDKLKNNILDEDELNEELKEKKNE